MAARKRVKPKDKARDIPAVKFDDTGKLTMLAVGGGYVMCRRPWCAPTTRTIKEWKSLSDKPWYEART
ncbi:hypothetical protein [Bradyrhizobium sp. SYSU BS000235]|uniref:hypothetical protein n=1 Tax=Bradyrhizobium sp. SYSU BS000235 TaxID=3411332 RepID=UPI003C73CD78